MIFWGKKIYAHEDTQKLILKKCFNKSKIYSKKREKFILYQQGSIGRNVPKICVVYKRPKYLCSEEGHLKDTAIFLALMVLSAHQR